MINPVFLITDRKASDAGGDQTDSKLKDLKDRLVALPLILSLTHC